VDVQKVICSTRRVLICFEMLGLDPCSVNTEHHAKTTHESRNERTPQILRPDHEVFTKPRRPAFDKNCQIPRSLGRHGCKYGHNNRTVYRDVLYNALAGSMVQWLAFVITEMNLRVLYSTFRMRTSSIQFRLKWFNLSGFNFDCNHFETQLKLITLTEVSTPSLSVLID
jgi:hypothetical protein